MDSFKIIMNCEFCELNPNSAISQNQPCRKKLVILMNPQKNSENRTRLVSESIALNLFNWNYEKKIMQISLSMQQN